MTDEPFTLQTPMTNFNKLRQEAPRPSDRRLSDREQIAALLYVMRFPHRTWLAASLTETALAYKQADAILGLRTTPGMTMTATHIYYGSREFFRMALENETGLPDGRWVPSRPSGTRVGFLARAYAAWLVFTGRADALVWMEDYYQRHSLVSSKDASEHQGSGHE